VRNVETVFKVWLFPMKVCEDESYEDEGCEEEEDALAELMELVGSLSARIEKLKADRACCSFEGSVEDFPVLEADVLDSPTDDDGVGDFIAEAPLYSAPDEPVVSELKEQIVVEEDSSLFLQEISHYVFSPGIEMKDHEIAPVLQDVGVLHSPSFDEYSDEENRSLHHILIAWGESQPVYDSYESDYELDMQDFQEHTSESYPLFTKEKYYEEINHPGPAEDTEQQSFPTILVYDDYESDPWESHEEEEEQLKVQFIACLEPVSEKPPPGISQPASSFHPPALARDIQPGVNRGKTEHVFCHQPSGFCHLSYEPVKEYMELHFLHVLKPPNFILTSTLEGKMKDVIVLLSRLHRLLLITDRIKELPVRKLLEWLWWKFSFT
jgi:hypothetical protein